MNSPLEISVKSPVVSTELTSLEFREVVDKLYTEERIRFGRTLDAMLTEAQNLRLVDGHKARGRTLCSEHVASAFREDAIKRIRTAVGDRATVNEDEMVDDRLSEVRPDLVIQSPNRDAVAVFLAQSAQRVNDAIFLQMSALYEAHRTVSVVAMLEADSSVSAKLRQRASNRLSAVPIYRNDEDQAVQRIVREVLGSGAMIH